MISIGLRRYSKILCVFTFFLIFLGGLVKSTESGLSVPDWPTTYGHFMFTFPLDQMVGGIKYEHTHRMLASLVGLMALIQCIGLLRSTQASWLKRLGIWAVVVVILQGVLGGLTVKFLLPVWLSSMHGVLAQTFLLMTVMMAYGLSEEYLKRRQTKEELVDAKFLRFVLILVGMIYIQLILGNLMRHTQSGLAVPDFPTMGGALLPSFSKEWLAGINQWRFENNLDPVKMGQVHLHLLHRFWALLILVKLLYIDFLAYQRYLNRPLVIKALFLLNLAVFVQIMLGVSTVLFKKEPITTTFHVTVGAAVLALSFLFLLRSAAIAWPSFCQQLRKQ